MIWRERLLRDGWFHIIVMPNASAGTIVKNLHTLIYEWLVLAKTDCKLLIIAEKSLLTSSAPKKWDSLYN